MKPGNAVKLSPFVFRHLGPQASDVEPMARAVGCSSLSELVDQTVPEAIRFRRELDLEPAFDERGALVRLQKLVSENQLFRSYIGQGFANCVTPTVIQRNILENPGWYTAYTPYQAEIAQGRLEALINFQSMIVDLTGLPIANASLLDEGTAAAEAMALCHRVIDDARMKFFVSELLHEHVREVIATRAEPLGIEIVVGDHRSAKIDSTFFAACIAYPGTDGSVHDYRAFCQDAQSNNVRVVVTADLLSLVLLTPPGSWGADVVVGNSQRFGVPFGYGGPHAAFLATRDEFKREIPGRLVGVSKDTHGKPAYRLSLQTREQHIRRDRATSNICTAQVLLAVIASMYAVYHGPRGLRRIAEDVHGRASRLADALKRAGIRIQTERFFDTFTFEAKDSAAVLSRCASRQINLCSAGRDQFSLTIDETVTEDDLRDLFYVIAGVESRDAIGTDQPTGSVLSREFLRQDSILTHPVFNRYHNETEMLRYIKRLEAKDLSLTFSMIPLGSCTMKLNASSEMYPVTWPAVGAIHPFAPLSQTSGYQKMFAELEQSLGEITGLPGVSLQPNAGSQGEYAGLLVIRAYHRARGDLGRRICLIPTSAHGTNPASAVMVGMEVVTVQCDSSGNVDVEDLRKKAEEYRDRLAALMVTYPSTHGVFEERIKEICEIIHNAGGQVYMDGANMNAQVGLCRPGDIGADVVHINLHKTFCIPHGGGGPGMGPICVGAHLREFLPGHPHLERDRKVSRGKQVGPVSSAPWGSASILPISWVYMKCMGAVGLRMATEIAILSANYVAARLEPHYRVLYRGKNGRVAHECILDMSEYKRTAGVDEVDVAKRLMDYGFHAPTVSFPVAGTLMVEPTESESRAELDRFCDAMISIRQEIAEIESGKADRALNVLKQAPHTAERATSDTWDLPYSRAQAVYPLPYLRERKFWPAIGRIDNAYGDRNLFCTCVPVEATEAQSREGSNAAR